MSPGKALAAEMRDRQQHQQEVKEFLAQAFGTAPWRLDLPQGRGHETYLARSGQLACFIKLGADLSRSRAMAALGLTPEVLASGRLADGVSLLVQAAIPGRSPTRQDYHAHLEQVAKIIETMHHSPLLQSTLPAPLTQEFSAAGLTALEHIQRRWLRCRPLVPQVAEYVDGGLEALKQQVQCFTGSGLVASHNDICNANWLVTEHGRWYLVDLEAMALDDPALDIGATLWWYYPARLRPRFLEISGYAGDEAFARRMQVRMAIHCLHILLPREQSFDRFSPEGFMADLVDFRAALAGEENPQGY